jgi:hypothetical protein
MSAGLVSLIVGVKLGFSDTSTYASVRLLSGT